MGKTGKVTPFITVRDLIDRMTNDGYTFAMDDGDSVLVSPKESTYLQCFYKHIELRNSMFINNITAEMIKKEAM